jgi:hypothetical protein
LPLEVSSRKLVAWRPIAVETWAHSVPVMYVASNSSGVLFEIFSSPGGMDVHDKNETTRDSGIVLSMEIPLFFLGRGHR